VLVEVEEALDVVRAEGETVPEMAKSSSKEFISFDGQSVKMLADIKVGQKQYKVADTEYAEGRVLG